GDRDRSADGGRPDRSRHRRHHLDERHRRRPRGAEGSRSRRRPGDRALGPSGPADVQASRPRRKLADDRRAAGIARRRHAADVGGNAMTKVIAGITMSLDGYVTGPNDRLGAGLGDDGERLHYWVFGGPWTYGRPTGSAVGVDRDDLDEVFASGGAWIVGRTMHDVVDGWGDDPGFGVPVFVVTHRPHETVVKGDTTFEFVTGGIAEALTRARAAAADKNVIVMGGADLLRQYLAAGVVDEFTL